MPGSSPFRGTGAQITRLSDGTCLAREHDPQARFATGRYVSKQRV
jgi:hypothetical protein